MWAHNHDGVEWLVARVWVYVIYAAYGTSTANSPGRSCDLRSNCSKVPNQDLRGSRLLLTLRKSWVSHFIICNKVIVSQVVTKYMICGCRGICLLSVALRGHYAMAGVNKRLLWQCMYHRFDMHVACNLPCDEFWRANSNRLVRSTTGWLWL